MVLIVANVYTSEMQLLENIFQTMETLETFVRKKQCSKHTKITYNYQIN